MGSIIEINHLKSQAKKAAEDLIRQTENRVSYYTLRQEVFDPILLEIEEQVGEPTRIELCENSLDINYSGTPAQMRRIFGILRKHGFEPDNRPKKEKSGYNSYFYNKQDHCIWFNFTSTVCRRVQIGVRTVEQPVYETVCDEDLT